MSLIRGGLIFFFTIVLFFSVFLCATFIIISFSLEYNNIKTELNPVLKEFKNGKLNLLEENFNLTREVNNNRDLMKKKCVNETSYVFSSGGYVFTLPCSLIEKNVTEEEFLDLGIESIIHDIYYKNYECDFLDCFNKKNPFFIISEKSKKYFWDKSKIAFIISLFIVFILFFLTKKKQNAIIILGSILIISALFIILIKKIFNFIFSGINFQLFSIFFSQSYWVVVTLLILGIIFIIFGISLKISITNLSKKKFLNKLLHKSTQK